VPRTGKTYQRTLQTSGSFAALDLASHDLPIWCETDATDRPALSQEFVVRSNKTGEPDLRLPPTLEAGAELQQGYEYFNTELFDSALPHCLITYTRLKRVFGYFCPDRFERSNGEVWSEIALNPSYLALRSDEQSLSTLVHEQCHLWRHYLGPENQKGGRGSGGYHDLVWARKMQEVGLEPSSTGAPGGAKTGNRVSHWIIPGGRFDVACSALLESGFSILWRDRLIRATKPADPNGDDGSEKKPKRDRIKFSCPQCTLNAWAKPSAKLTCTTCGVAMRSADAPTASSRSPLPVKVEGTARD